MEYLSLNNREHRPSVVAIVTPFCAGSGEKDSVAVVGALSVVPVTEEVVTSVPELLPSLACEIAFSVSRFMVFNWLLKYL